MNTQIWPHEAARRALLNVSNSPSPLESEAVKDSDLLKEHLPFQNVKATQLHVLGSLQILHKHLLQNKNCHPQPLCSHSLDMRLSSATSLSTTDNQRTPSRNSPNKVSVFR